MTSNIVVGPLVVELPAPFVAGCHSIFFAEFIEDDDVLFFTRKLPISAKTGMFSDSLRAKLICAETFWRHDVTLRSRCSSGPGKGDSGHSSWLNTVGVSFTKAVPFMNYSE